MKTTTQSEIKNLIQVIISSKISEYKAETDYKPFFVALVDKSLIIQSSILHSLYTSFGMSIYEQMAQILAINEGGYECSRQYLLLGSINDKTKLYIDEICEVLSSIFRTFRNHLVGNPPNAACSSTFSDPTQIARCI